MPAFSRIRSSLRAQGLVAASRVLVLAGVLLAGLGLAFWCGAALRSEAREEVRAELARAARERVELLRSQLLRSTEILNSIVAYFEASQEVSRAEFRRFVSPALARQPELQALEWIPRVPLGRRAALERAAEADGLDGFRVTEFTAVGELVPAAERAEYFPVFYVEPLRGNAPALGLDLAHHEPRRGALERARGTGLPAATPPIRLAQGPDTGAGFLVFAPVRAPGGELLGFALAVFRVDRLVEASLAPLAARGLGVELVDEATPGRQLHIVPPAASPGATAASSAVAAWSHEEALAFAGRSWRVRVVASPGTAAFAAAPGLVAWVAPAGILALAGLLAGYLLAGFRRTAEIERKVAEKTAQLSREVAERQRAEAAAREAEQRYRSIFENAIDGIFQSTPDGRYLGANPALARIYGYDTPEALLAACSDIGRQLYVDPGRRAEFVREIEARGAVADFVSEVRRRDGSVIWISEKALAVRDPGTGAVLYFEGIVEDVTERRAAAEALHRANEILEERVADRTARLAEANAALLAEIEVRKGAEAAAEAASRAKSRFLADMSHELRTPLNAVLGYTQLLQLDPALVRARGSALHAIVEGGQHLLCLVDGVLDLSKIEAGRMDLEPAPFDLNVLLRGLQAIFGQRASQKRLALRVEFPAATPVWLRGDEGKLRQILINLLGNAVKFTERGEVRLRVLPADGPGRFRFEVIDTGAGIPPEAQARLFEPFHQEQPGRARGGTGLGLSISRRLVALLGGELALNSRPGWGSNFHFTLGFASAPPLADLADPAGAAPALLLAPGARVRALVLDDLPANREVLAALLAHHGCEVRVVETPAEAERELFAVDGDSPSAASSGSAFDLAFVDQRLGEADGVAWVAALLARHPTLPVRFVAYSASDFAEDRARCLAAGFHRVLPKPLRLADLVGCLRELLPDRFLAIGPAPSHPVAREPAPANALPPLALPEADLLALRAAADIGDCAELRRLVATRFASPELSAWREHLDGLLDRFDTDAIAGLLAAASPEPAATP